MGNDAILQDIFFKGSLVCYLLAFVLRIVTGRRQGPAEPVAVWLLRLGFLWHCLMIAGRWYAAGRPPFANMYEALVLFSWAAVLVFLVFDLLYAARFMLGPVAGFAALLGGLALAGDSAIKPLMPALQSRWMAVHVLSYFIGYAALSVAFLLGCLYLFAGRRATAPALQRLDEAGYRLVAFGFPFLSVGMITGSVWANVAWGNYWFWDPKETCSLITWLVYLLYLHLRCLRGWKGRRSALLLAAGFIATLFTFIGVNYILAGLHSYVRS